MNQTLFAAPALAATVSALAVWLLARAASALPPDVPNARSLHVRPVPRAGGYAIWAGFIPAALLFAAPVPVDW
jgi:UDP-N-acetylmuramyl pentapeptide phosphotransferase/UDP-N-acetylglucosamine-1-phosphate transferase